MSEREGRRRLVRATVSLSFIVVAAVLAFMVLGTRAVLYGADVWGWIVVVTLVGGVALRVLVVLAATVWGVRVADWLLVGGRPPPEIDKG